MREGEEESGEQRRAGATLQFQFTDIDTVWRIISAAEAATSAALSVAFCPH